MTSSSTPALRRPRLLTALVLAACWIAPAVAAPVFSGIGFIPGEVRSRVLAVSADGAVAVGLSGPAGSSEAIRFTPGEGVVPFVTGLGEGDNAATAVSADGSVAVGVAGGRAFRATLAFGTTGLGTLPGTATSAARAVSADGSVIVGDSGSGAFRWTDPTGMSALAGLAGETVTRALGVSADGSVVVGYSGSATGGPALRWESGLVDPHQLAPLLGDANDIASAVSADGSVLVGRSGTQAARWTAADTGWAGGGVVQGLGTLAGASDSEATAISADGSVIVGHSGAALFIWDALFGMRDLVSVFTDDYGLNLSGWTLSAVTGLSADGLVIGGWGFNPQGQEEGWLALLRTQGNGVPLPSTLTLVLAALIAMPMLRRRLRSAG